MRYVWRLSTEQTQELVDVLDSWKDAGEVRRARAVCLSSKGYTIKESAEVLDVCFRSVRNWIRRYEKGGLAKLKTQPKSERPSPVSSPP